MDHFVILANVYRKILSTVGSAPIESGGILACRNNEVCEFWYDACAGSGSRLYKPSAAQVSNVVSTWQRQGMEFFGFLHSHPEPYRMLSGVDVAAGEQTMYLNGMNHIYMGILCGGTLYLYKITAAPGKDHPYLETCSFVIQ